MACLAATMLSAWPCAAGNDTQRPASELRTKYAADIEELAQWCEANGLTDEARKTRHALRPSDPYKLYLPVLPDEVGPPRLPADAPEKVVEWDARLQKLRSDQAKALYDVARRAVRTGRAGLAFELAMAAIQANPDFEPVRRLLGYQKFRDQWRTFYAAKKLRDGQVWSEKFGWLPKAHLGRYEEGQRFYKGHWISAAEDADRHRDILSGWNVETEHYTIRTNLSIEAGVALGVKLDRLYRIWQQIFAGYYASEADVVAFFEGRAAAKSAALPPLQIMYFRDRDDYIRFMRPIVPGIEISTGIYYFDQDHPPRAYFFAGEGSDEGNMYHEATHQLFHQSRPVAPDVGWRANFWIVEGVAMYMESLRQEDGYYVLGGFDTPRMHAARVRLLEKDYYFYVPLEQFTTYGMEKFQKDPQVPKFYSQAAGQTNFLIHYDGGRYRDALVAYLVAVYTGRDQPGTLAKLTGTSYGELDRQYREFIKSGSPKAEEVSPSR